jgi:hypothetical protein
MAEKEVALIRLQHNYAHFEAREKLGCDIELLETDG